MKNTNTGVKKCFISLLSDPVLHFFEDLRGIKLEEVELHRLRDAEQQGAVNVRFPEDLVEMVAGTGNLLGQPRHTALVGLQLLLNKAPDVDFVGFFFRHNVGVSAKVNSRQMAMVIHFIHFYPKLSISDTIFISDLDN